MTERINVGWRRRHEFAEVAEVLRVATDQIVGMREANGATTVLYSDDQGERPDVYAVGMRRDEAGVLHVVAGPRLVPGFYAFLESQDQP